MKILALNSGSSSIKYTLFDAAQHYKVLLKGNAERIGQSTGKISQLRGKEKFQQELPSA